ncbi:hypothetical protein V8C35DRAFT_274747 [Trichoderma chlorosporum]
MWKALPCLWHTELALEASLLAGLVVGIAGVGWRRLRTDMLLVVAGIRNTSNFICTAVLRILGLVRSLRFKDRVWSCCDTVLSPGRQPVRRMQGVSLFFSQVAYTCTT